ncbi:NYN domain-containing protein [Phellopilus nigrolimitatus]|nr:NYN domain-containing protein [Phellopilus nigrolimitatus]
MCEKRIGIFWDYENCHPPSTMSGYLVTERIRQAVQPLGPILVFKAYMDANLEASKVAQQHELQCSGVSLIHTPHNGKKEVADKILLVDLIIFAIEGQGPATVVLITGDRDFSYALSVLRLRGHEVVLISPTLTPQHGLLYSANVILDWKSDILKHPEPGAKKRTSSSQVSIPAAPPEIPTSASPLLAQTTGGKKSLPITDIMRMWVGTPKDGNVALEHSGIIPVIAEDAPRPTASEIRTFSGSYLQSFEQSSVENRSASSDVYFYSAQKIPNDYASDSSDQTLSSNSSLIPGAIEVGTPRDENQAVSSRASSQDVVSDVSSLVGTVSDAEGNVFVADTPDTSFCEDIGNANIDCGFTAVEIGEGFFVRSEFELY